MSSPRLHAQMRILLEVILFYFVAAFAVFAWRDQSHLTFMALFFLGLLVIVLFHIYLSRFLISPIVKLSSLAMTWLPGSSIPGPSPDDTHEVQNLQLALQFLLDRLSKEVKKANELADFKGQLVTTIIHELNNSLSVVSGAITLLRDTDPDTDEKRLDYYATARMSIRSLSLQIETLLNMARLESGKLALRFKCIDVRKIIVDCLERLKILHERKGQEIALDFAAESLCVRADPEALNLVVMNLLSNAIKYTPARGRIAVRVRVDPSDPTRAQVSISDTGIGISPEDQKMIFSGYYRTEISKATAKGFGVGLPLASKILEAHYSSLSVESAPGQGSTFRFSLRQCVPGPA